ncbi:hypothetical protein GGQ73_001859 [Rhizobium skierniewicense]|uniref:J domain-containing protein n=1 Tax=Rhizobium skierniewicense TaxID=984260 RepID=A0A7W6C8J8_9HYPH|nr:hypothetical protein [Rhizobium skierniewicense]MBB3945913.1 hypothetical protein [Rhizobium skierniewicense]
MLFGQSVFQSVVERLERENESDLPEETSRSGSTINSFSASLVFETATQEPLAANRHLDSYLGFIEHPVAHAAPEPEPEIMPPHLEKTALSDVSDELAINDKDTLETLSEKRRNFARLNHPDMVNPQFRENANLRMKAANLLIDQAIRFIAR